MKESEIKKLQPQKLWEYFVELSAIPRPSKFEDQARDYVLSKAGKLGLPTFVDSAGNLLVTKEAGPGKENRLVTILQSHLDMVCVAEKGHPYESRKDPIRLASDGIHVTANGTSLGADNGIGVAAMMAFMEDPALDAGPLEFLFTVDEETGLTGALGMDTGVLKGRRLLNLDTKEEGTLYIGCAGGLDIWSSLAFSTKDVHEENCPLTIRVEGLTGGHSGIDINKPRANAIKILACALKEISKSVEFNLLSLTGGNKSNVIPREAEGSIMAPGAKFEEIKIIIQNFFNIKNREYDEEPGMLIKSYSPEKNGLTRKALDPVSTERLIGFLVEAPHGVLGMSSDLPDLVETSTNLATVRMEGDKVTIGMNCRSPRASSIDSIATTIDELAAGFGMKTVGAGRYPGWQPDLESSLLKAAREVYKEMFGLNPKVTAIHAGLECGVIGSKYPGMDMISLGATMENLHSPSEKVDIASVLRFWDFLKALLASL